MDFHRIKNVLNLDFEEVKNIVLNTNDESFEFNSSKFLEGSFGIVYFHNSIVIKNLKYIKDLDDNILNGDDEFCYTIICSESISSLRKFSSNFLKFKGFKRLVHDNEIYNFLSYEKVNGDLYDLFEFYRVNTSTLKNIIFQLCMSLYISRTKIGFTHQDLHCGNVLFSRNEILYYDYVYYYIDDKLYNIPKSEFIFILSDFDTSILDNLSNIENKNLITLRERKKIKVKHFMSETGDIIYFIYDLYNTFKYQFNKYTPIKVKKFLLSVMKYVYSDIYLSEKDVSKNLYFSYFEDEPEDLSLKDFIDKFYSFIKYEPKENEIGFCLGLF